MSEIPTEAMIEAGKILPHSMSSETALEYEKRALAVLARHFKASAPQEPVATGCPQTVFPDQQNFTQELRATAAGFAKFPQERSTATKLIKAADLIDALTSRRPQEPVVDDDDETYEIGKRDGYERAVQEIDQLTGGDGEYRYVIGIADDRHCPDAETMKRRIVERFDRLQAKAPETREE